MRFVFRHNRCEGWYQAILVDGNERTADERASAQFADRNDAIKAAQYCMKNGKFPIEVEEAELEICEHCGRSLEEVAQANGCA